ncbi:MAG TPA: MAP7 domain-containing protein [Kofleriaceae bacterium]|nr:MAP7 domain-containing protein [Kofleriaceae bacterium]
MRYIDHVSRWGIVLTVAITAAAPRGAAADPDADLKLFGSVNGVELWFAMNRPNKGCVYGSVKNRTQDDVEVSWGYDAGSESGARRSVAEAPDSPWPLGPGQSVGGWAAIMWCPFNKNFGANATEQMTSLQVINVRVRNLSTVRREEERKRQEAEAQRRREQEEKDRLAKQEEERKQREEEDRKRQEDERKRQEEDRKRQDAEKQRLADQSKKADERKRRDAEERAKQAQLAEQQRQERIAKGFQDLNAAQETNRKMGESSAAVAGAVFAMEGGNEGTEATTRALRVGFGFGGKFLPHMSNTRGGDVVEESTTNTGGGFAFDGSLELWPLYRKKWGIGIGGEGGLAGMALPGGAMYSLNVGLGVKGYYGNRSRWTIRSELDFGARLVGSAANLFGAIVSGSGSYSLWRFGFGPGFCKTASAAGFCETSFYAMLFLDWTSVTGAARSFPMGGSGEERRTGKIIRLGMISKYAPYGMGLEIDLGFGYPAPGETDYPIQPGDEDRAGTYFAFSLRKAWTWHSGGAKR